MSEYVHTAKEHMKKLTKKEQEEVVALTRGPGKNNTHEKTQEFFDLVDELKVTETAFISISEWFPKTPPYVLIQQMSREGRRFDGRKYSGSTLTDNSGWIVTRVE